MLTTVGKRGDAARLQELGFSAYLTKPVKQLPLYDCLAGVLGRRELPPDSLPRPILTQFRVAEDRKFRTRILLAEDNPTNQLVAIKLLEKLGYRADCVSTGREVLKALGSVAYDLVFMDIQMPELDGFEATRRIRNPKSSVLNHHVPIIAMTAHAMKGDREMCLEKGMNDYIAKPINPQELLETIERQLHHGSAKPITPPAEADSLVFNKKSALDRIGGDENVLKEILGVFSKDAMRQIALLDQAIKDRNPDTMGRQAHSLKSAAGNVGAMIVARIALDMETAGRQGDLTPASALLLTLRAEFERFQRCANI
jgi:CheY-like chemotaxis protein/HPt (histidine-containing phosphotransfer) domain-containing protein